jgi:hypothetical protein
VSAEDEDFRRLLFDLPDRARLDLYTAPLGDKMMVLGMGKWLESLPVGDVIG